MAALPGAMAEKAGGAGWRHLLPLNLEKAFQRRDAEKKGKDTEAWRKFQAYPSGELVFLCVPLLAPCLYVERSLATAVFRIIVAFNKSN